MPKGRLRTEPADVTLIVHDPIQPPAIDAADGARRQGARRSRPRDRRRRGRGASVGASDRVRPVRSFATCRCHRQRTVTVGSNGTTPMAPPMLVTAIIAAGGRGQRFGGVEPKQLLAIGGRADSRAQRRRRSSRIPSIDEVVVALPRRARGRSAAVSAPARAKAAAPRRRRRRAGRTRWPTRFSAVDATSDIIVIHDAARPFVERRSHRPDDRGRRRVGRCAGGAAGARHGEAVGPADGRRRAGFVQRNAAARDDLSGADAAGVPARRAARRARARRASARGDRRGDARRARRASRAPRRGRGDEHQDHDCRTICAVAEAHRRATARRPRRRAPAAPAPATICIGWSTDVRWCWAASTIPSDRGALGHSDADVVCHAVTDAILGAAVPRRHRPSLSGLRPAVEGRVEPRSAAAGGRARRGAGLRGRQRRRHGRFSKRRRSAATSTRCARRSPARSASTSRA